MGGQRTSSGWSWTLREKNCSLSESIQLLIQKLREKLRRARRFTTHCNRCIVATVLAFRVPSLQNFDRGDSQSDHPQVSQYNLKQLRQTADTDDTGKPPSKTPRPRPPGRLFSTHRSGARCCEWLVLGPCWGVEVRRSEPWP